MNTEQTSKNIFMDNIYGKDQVYQQRENYASAFRKCVGNFLTIWRPKYQKISPLIVN